jgi:hypothetical protein
LEKHGLSSPKMTIFSRGTKLEIELLFESQRDESLVRAELPRTMVRKIKALAMAREIKLKENAGHGRHAVLPQTAPGQPDAMRVPSPASTMRVLSSSGSRSRSRRSASIPNDEGPATQLRPR